ncbi:excalibur calcium-binding domain-containing protein [Corynebacterium sp.]|nr:excalibur calcium-binding domain-containing protein [Corynebacterium sp.]
MTPLSPTRPRKLIRRILAFATVGLGLLLSLTSFGMGDWRDILGGILLGVAFMLPGAWFLWQEKIDRDKLAAYDEAVRQHSYYSGLLGPEDHSVVSGMGTPVPPQPTNRRWGLVYLGAVVIFAVGAAVLPPVEPRPDGGTTVTTTPTSTSQAPERVTETVVVTSTTDPEPTPTTDAPSPVQATTQVMESHHTPMHVPSPEQADTQPQNFLAPAPAPEPAPAATYYPNCAAARAAGVAPIYEGQPGYGTHLDRDRDGIACE